MEPKPSFVDQALAVLAAGEYAKAGGLLRQALKHAPEHAQAWFLLGASCHAQKELNEAREAFSRACALAPEHLQARFALTAVSLELGQVETAVRIGQEAVGMAPRLPLSHVNLAIALETSGQNEEALASYDHALQLDPGYLDALKNRGALLLSLKRVNEAMDNGKRFIASHPQRHDGWFSFGNACLAALDFQEAVTAFKKSRAIAPAHVGTLLHGGHALAIQENFDCAQEWLDRAAEINPSEAAHYWFHITLSARETKYRIDARTLYLLFQYERIEAGDWTLRNRFLECFQTLIEKTGRMPLDDFALGFRAMVMGLPAASQLKLAKQIAAEIIKGIPETSKCIPNNHGDTTSRRLRIGYLSPDFKSHAMSLLANQLFHGHDRNKFETFGYALGGDDQSTMRREIVARFEHFADLDLLDDASAAQRIAADRIDILIDLAGYTNGARPGIMARRPAPLQLSWLGYIATMGAPWIDYMVADGTIVSHDQEEGYSEAILRLSQGLYLCSYANEAISSTPSREEASLPAKGGVLAAMNSVNKIDPQIFEIWMRLLKSVPDTVLWLLDCGSTAQANLQKAAQNLGVDPSRLCFAQRIAHAQHRARLQLADLALDTYQCNGHTTTADALSAGIPVLTCIGKLPAQRVAASMLFLAGLDETIVTNLDDYEKLALDLLNNPEKIGRLKQKLKDARTTAPFFQPMEWVREFEAGLQQIWERHCTGLPPVSMDVQYAPKVARKFVKAIY